MTKKAYRKLIAGHLQWSMIGLIVALFVAFISSDHRTMVYGESPSIAPPTSIAPAAAPSPLTPKGGTPVIPDTVDGKLVWPDPWDQIAEYPQRNY
jgi:hypothetical protein